MQIAVPKERILPIHSDNSVIDCSFMCVALTSEASVPLSVDAVTVSVSVACVVQ
jgi:hypothetical protein